MEIAGEEREQDEWFVCAAVHLHPNALIFCAAWPLCSNGLA